ncbi:MAG: aminoacyl-tRNA hydrolase [Candidatus Moranbacteria bacterium]|nr:aminoacyl-tRNA hydrolase [Candidatus Moranbacteria bacterium]
MKLIIGLGNPGQKYESTRHNLGFIFLDKLQGIWSLPEFKLEKKFTAQISHGELNNQKIILAKPQNFMNLSGEAVQKILAFYKLDAKDLLIIHDDIDIVCGKYKLATDSTSAGHNGVQNIIDTLGTKKFARLRIGIKNELTDSTTTQLEVSDFVLGKLSPEELEKIAAIEKGIIEEIEKIIA